MFIHRLLYRSESALAGSENDVDEQLRAIVEFASKANKNAGVTGALLLSSGVFVQVLEGSLDAVERAFESICADLRHRRVRLLQLAVAEDRLFDGWSMSRVAPTAELARLCPTLDAAPGVRLDATKANAALHMMRERLLAERAPPTRPELVWRRPPGGGLDSGAPA